jgi:hypothetical protein
MVAVITVRISLCLTLIRLKDTPAWTRGLYYFMGANTIVLLGLILTSVFRCQPVRAAFDLSVTGASCFDSTISLALVYTTNGNSGFVLIVNISLTAVVGVLFLSDLFFAFAPLTFLHRLRRPLRERIFIGAIMAIGLLAIATSIAKLYLLYQFWFLIAPGSENYNFVNFLIPTWCEVFITIIGATVPCLTSLLIIWIRKCGFMREQQSNVWGLGGRIDLTDVDVKESADKSTRQSEAKVQEIDMESQREGQSSSIGSEPTVVAEGSRNSSTR